MVNHRKRLTTNIVFLLSSLSAVVLSSVSVHIFIALLLHLKTLQEFLTANATLKRNEYLAKRKRIAVKKARALLSRPGWASQTVYMRKSCLAYPGYPTGRGETTRLPELSRPPHVNG